MGITTSYCKNGFPVVQENPETILAFIRLVLELLVAFLPVFLLRNCAPRSRSLQKRNWRERLLPAANSESVIEKQIPQLADVALAAD
jgi:hypothetical protein